MSRPAITREKRSAQKTAGALVMHVLTALDYGGVERHMEAIASAERDATMRHLFVTIGRGGATEQRLRTRGAEVVCLNQPAGIPSVSAIRALLGLMWRMKPAVVHAHGAEANFHGLLAGWLARVPVRLGEEIGIPSHSARAERVFRAVFRRAHRVIGVSPVVTEWLITHGEVDAQRAVTLLNPVMLPLNVGSGVMTSDRFQVCFIGRLEPVKNPLILIDAAEQLRARGVPIEFLVAGAGSLADEMQRRVADRRLSREVRLLGYQADPGPLMMQCQLAVQPSLSEGFGIALIEAMGHGLPVVATRVGSAPDLIEPGRNGWLMDEPCSENLAALIYEAWVLGSEQLAEMGAAARATVAGKFLPQGYIARLESLYRAISVECGRTLQ